MNTNSIDQFRAEYGEFTPSGTVTWGDPTLASIVRLRYISDPGFPMWDLSYCYGVLRDGTQVRVQLPAELHQVSKCDVKSAIVQSAQRAGVFAKGLGIFEALSFCQ